jgi:hypothetical protein
VAVVPAEVAVVAAAGVVVEVVEVAVAAEVAVVAAAGVVVEVVEVAAEVAARRWFR